MKILAVILSILALTWNLYQHYEIFTLRNGLKTIQQSEVRREVFIYQIQPNKYQRFGRITAKGEIE